MRVLFYLMILIVPALGGDFKSTTGNIFFDRNDDNVIEMSLTGNGLGVGIDPQADLHVAGNAVVTEELILKGGLEVEKNLTFGFQVVSSNVTLGESTQIFADELTSDIILTLPSAEANTGKMYSIKKKFGKYSVFVIREGKSIDDFSSIELKDTNYVSLMSDGGDWHIVHKGEGGASEGVVAADNLLGWWKFDEESGVVANDTTKNNHNASLESFDSENIGNEGIVGKSISFDGGNYVSIPDHEDLRPSGNNVSVSLWAKMTENSNAVLFSKRQDTGAYNQLTIGQSDSYKDYTVAGNRITMFLRKDGTEYMGVRTNGVVTGKWQHIVCVVNYLSKSIQIYIDGQSVILNLSGPFNTVDGALPIVDNDAPISIGRLADAYTDDTSVDDVRYYNKALSSEEVQKIYDQGK